MSFLRRVLGGRSEDEAAPAPPVTLDVGRRTEQLQQLENVLDRLVEAMEANTERRANPAWRERTAEYRRLSGETHRLRARSFTREEILDLVFEVRPAFVGDQPPDVEAIQPLERELMEAAEALREVLPGEQG